MYISIKELVIILAIMIGSGYIFGYMDAGGDAVKVCEKQSKESCVIIAVPESKEAY